MSEIYLPFIFAHYGSYGNAPVRKREAAAGGGNAIVDADDGISLALVPVHSTDQTIKPKTKTEFVHTILYNRSVA